MFIRITRSGGFAGLEAEPVAAIDTRSLTEEHARRIEECVAGLVSREAAEESPAADMVRFEVEIVQENGQRRTMAFSSETPDTPPSALEKLIDLLVGPP